MLKKMYGTASLSGAFKKARSRPSRRPHWTDGVVRLIPNVLRNGDSAFPAALFVSRATPVSQLTELTSPKLVKVSATVVNVRGTNGGVRNGKSPVAVLSVSA